MEPETPDHQNSQKMLTTTHKTYYYIFLPSKATEELVNAGTVPYRPTRYLMEIRDIYEPPIRDPANPWCIKKKVSWFDIREGRIILTHQEAFDHVFRYWNLGLASWAVFGYHKMETVIFDHTNWLLEPKKHEGPNVYLMKGPLDTYFIGWADIARDLRVHDGDEIGLYWDEESDAFHFKLLKRHTPRLPITSSSS